MREILRDAVKDEDEAQIGLGTQIVALFAECGLEEGEDIPEQRAYPARPAEFDP